MAVIKCAFCYSEKTSGRILTILSLKIRLTIQILYVTYHEGVGRSGLLMREYRMVAI